MQGRISVKETVSERLPYGAATGQERSLSRTAYEQLLDKLMRREIPVGSVLLERRLAEQMEMSRTPVREALNRLENEGFVTRQPGGLLVVREFSVRELIETLHLRQILEAESVSLATGRIAEAEIDSIAQAIEALMAKAEPTAEEDWAVDSRFHQTIADHSGNAALAKLIFDLRLKTHMFNLERVPERFEVGHREHLAVLAALKRQDRDAARDGIRTHIENVRLSIIEKLNRI
jgi:DNA-binding GntR family transcriptional regulator